MLVLLFVKADYTACLAKGERMLFFLTLCHFSPVALQMEHRSYEEKQKHIRTNPLALDIKPVALCILWAFTEVLHFLMCIFAIETFSLSPPPAPSQNKIVDEVLCCCYPVVACKAEKTAKMGWSGDEWLRQQRAG